MNDYIAEIKRRIEEIGELSDKYVSDAVRKHNELFEFAIELIATEDFSDQDQYIAEIIAREVMKVWELDIYDCGCSTYWKLDELEEIDLTADRTIYKWIEIIKLKKKTPQAKTDQYIVVNKRNDLLGRIYWRNGFRQYVFSTHEEYPVDLSRSCMKDICDFIDELMELRKK